MIEYYNEFDIQKLLNPEKEPLVDSFGGYLEAPRIGTEYYRISLANNVYTALFQGAYLEMKLLENGNMFDTKENALTYIKYKKAKRRLIKRMTELNNGYDDDEDDFGCRIYYSRVNNQFMTVEDNYASTKPVEGLTFRNWRLRNKFMFEMGADLRIYLRLEED